MLTIQEMENRGIVLTDEEQEQIFPVEPFQVIKRKRPKNQCQLCKGKTYTIFEYALLDLCPACCNQLVRKECEKAIRATPAPPKSRETLKRAEYYAIVDVMRIGMNITDSAAALGITRATMYAKLREHGIDKN